jgi:hypothetical protein
MTIQDATTDYETRSAETLAAVQAGGPEAMLDSRVTDASAAWTATGSCAFATAFIYGTVSCDLDFNTGQKMNFYGQHWGLGLGGGISAGGAVFSVSPDALLGEGTYEVHSVAGVGGFVQVVFFKNGSVVGVFTGAALAVNVSIGGGSGRWKMR